MRGKKLLAIALSAGLLVTGLGQGACLSGNGAGEACGNGVQTVYAESVDTSTSREDSAAGDNRIRVDLNRNDGRSNARSPLFDNWIVTDGTSDSETIDGVTFTLSNGGTAGDGIKASNSKTLIESDGTTPYLTMDGVYIDGASSGGTIRLDIDGLSAGTHTLTTWHSFFDSGVDGSSMSITINGTVTATGVPGPTRVSRDEDAGMSYSTFTVSEGETVTVLIQSEGNASYKNAILNAFEIDGEDPLHGISDASPADGAWHHEETDGLSWTAADGALSHDVYLGTSYAAVDAATTASAEYKGNQTETTYALSDLSPYETYYWRVDEVYEDGTVKGEIRAFEIGRLAFPTAEGYGRYAKAGRGGRIIEVTNLNDSGEGSLRQAVEVEKGPRIVVFKVGGVIKLESKLTVPADGGNLYVAGQTAPGDGITLTYYNFGIYYASDVVIRDVRVRVGDGSGVTMDGMGMAGADYSIIDHCSISWTTDEGTSSRSAKNITFQHNIIAEALNNSIHYDGSDRTQTERHSFAGSISGNVGSYHHNLLVNCTGRNWSLAGGMEQDAKRYAGKLDIRNNVVYNWKDRTTDGGVAQVNFVNNYYKQGAVSKNMNIFSIDGDELSTGYIQMAYLSGNKMVKKDGSVILSDTEDTWTKATSKYSTVSEVKSTTPFFESYVKTETADEAYESVLANVGANVPKQDTYDTRYISETRNGTYTYKGSKDGWKGIIDSQDDVGGYPDNTTFTGGEAPTDSDHDGMPDTWEEEHGLDPNDASDANGLDLSDEYYTNVEMYLNELAGDPVVYSDGDAEETTAPSETPSTTPTVTPSATPSTTPTTTPSATPTATPSAMPSATPSAMPTATPSATPTATPTATPSAPTTTPSATPTETPSATPSASSSAAPSEMPSAASSATPTTTPSATPTVTPTATPSASSSAAPSETPSAASSATPTATSSAAPTTTPSATPSATETPGETETSGATSQPDFLRGDVDLDGSVTASDALEVLQHVVKLRTLTGVPLAAAEVTNDGQVNADDALAILQYAVRLITRF